MERVKVRSGPMKGLIGDGTYFPNSRHYYVSFPDRKNPFHNEEIPPNQVITLCNKGPAQPTSILEKREFVTLLPKKEHVQIIGCKVSCGSVWCQQCFVRKSGSKRIANRLAQLDWRATRHVVLTVDLKKFNGSGQCAFEHLKEIGAINQFIHNLKRTAKIEIVDWVWILEWHSDGAPHWHLFIQTQKGKCGKIGNENLLKHWKYGLVFESYIKSKAHWGKFTSYFGDNGYFDPKSRCETKDKSHQLELPDWANSISYRIRKTGSMVKKEMETNASIEGENKKIDEKCIEENCNEAIDQDPKTYYEILESCGQATMCQIRRGNSYLVWAKLPIPYAEFKTYPGHYIENSGYLIQMDINGFFQLLERIGQNHCARIGKKETERTEKAPSKINSYIEVSQVQYV